MKKRFNLFLLLLIIFVPFVAKANIICNDGTVSRSCQDCHQGCCRGHDGCTDNPNHNSNSNSNSSSENYIINKPTTTTTTYASSSYNTTKEKDEIEDEDVKYGILAVSAVSFVTAMICYVFIRPAGQGGKM